MGVNKIIIINHNGHEKLSYSLKNLVINNNNFSSISVASLFSLTSRSGAVHERLLDAEQLRPIVENVLGAETFWDTQISKGAGEFLVSGAAYSTKPVSTLNVSIKVGDISKQLMVSGDRTWTQFGISDAVPFKVMPLNYNYAFGGLHYEQNPVGKGHMPVIGIGTQLPNIENPDQQILTPFDTPEVAGFEPYPLNWPQRKLPVAIDFDQNPVVFSSEITPIHFNTAPVDQRLSGFFVGDEAIEIKNMHPLLPTINSSLPGLRLRIFVVQTDADGVDDFREVTVFADTLWLLPNLGCGVLMYRMVCPIANIDASDIKYVYTVLEELKDEPKPIEYYVEDFISVTEEESGSEAALCAAEAAAINQNSSDCPNIEQEQVNTEPESDVDAASPVIMTMDNSLQAGGDDLIQRSSLEVNDVDDESAAVEEFILEFFNKTKHIATGGDIPGINDEQRMVFAKLFGVFCKLGITENSMIKEFLEKRKKDGLPLYLLEDGIIEKINAEPKGDPEQKEYLSLKLKEIKELRLNAIKEFSKITGGVIDENRLPLDILKKCYGDYKRLKA